MHLGSFISFWMLTACWWHRGTVAFTAAISCCAMARQWQSALRLLQRMEQEEVRFQEHSDLHE